jgi:hypothetical protein
MTTAAFVYRAEMIHPITVNLVVWIDILFVESLTNHPVTELSSRKFSSSPTLRVHFWQAFGKSATRSALISSVAKSLASCHIMMLADLSVDGIYQSTSSIGHMSESKASRSFPILIICINRNISCSAAGSLMSRSRPGESSALQTPLRWSCFV